MTKEVWRVDCYHIQNELLQQKLDDGWEPFAVSMDSVVWLRKLIKLESKTKHNMP